MTHPLFFREFFCWTGHELLVAYWNIVVNFTNIISYAIVWIALNRNEYGTEFRRVCPRIEGANPWIF